MEEKCERKKEESLITGMRTRLMNRMHFLLYGEGREREREFSLVILVLGHKV